MIIFSKLPLEMSYLIDDFVEGQTNYEKALHKANFEKSLVYLKAITRGIASRVEDRKMQQWAEDRGVNFKIHKVGLAWCMMIKQPDYYISDTWRESDLEIITP